MQKAGGNRHLRRMPPQPNLTEKPKATNKREVAMESVNNFDVCQLETRKKSEREIKQT